MVKLKIKRLYDDAKLPTKGDPTDEGWDVYVHSKEYDDNGNVVYKTGIAMELDKGYFADFRCRSSNAKYDLELTNGVGTIDNGYRGEIMGKFKRLTRYKKFLGILFPIAKFKEYEVGDKFAQLVIHKSVDVELEEATELSKTKRGEGSYGSTGK